jgi:hypothetical protein
MPAVVLPWKSTVSQRRPIGGVMVSVLASSAADRGFEPRSRQAKDYANGICYFSLSTRHAGDTLYWLLN